ncbi:MAG: hypothetical protein HQM00_02400 [Magnetococcales bacterium]|nr:hypothetical protein [Magnetococcales bacterium]
MSALYQYLALIGSLILLEGIIHIVEFHAVPGVLVLLTALVVAFFSSGPAFKYTLRVK